MTKTLLIFLFFITTTTATLCQKKLAISNKLWTESDRDYIVKGLERTKNEVFDELKNLDDKYWNLKDDSTCLSVGQIINYLILQDNRYKKEISLCIDQPDHTQFIKRSRENDQILLNSAEYETKKNPVFYKVMQSQSLSRDKADYVFNETRNQLCDFVLHSKDNFKKELRLKSTPFASEIENHDKFNIKYINHLLLACISQTEKHINLLRKIKQHANIGK